MADLIDNGPYKEVKNPLRKATAEINALNLDLFGQPRKWLTLYGLPMIHKVGKKDEANCKLCRSPWL